MVHAWAMSILNTFNCSSSFLCFVFYDFSLFLKGVCVSGIGGLGDMKLIFGTTAARKRGKAGKEDKVRKGLYSPSLFLLFFSCAYFWSSIYLFEFQCSFVAKICIFFSHHSFFFGFITLRCGECHRNIRWISVYLGKVS